MKGIITRGVGGLYYVRGNEDDKEYVLRARGIFRKRHVTPLVGDRVEFTPGQGEEHGWLEEIEPRLSESLRPPVANVELLMLVVAPVPEPDLLLIDRLIVRALASGMQPMVLVNKSDLDPQMYERIVQEYQGTPLEVMRVCAHTGEGLDALRERMRGHIVCFAGQSAVGKSSLINALFGLSLETGGLSRKTERGRHTTRHAELLFIGDMRLMDTPGFSLLTLEETLEPEKLREYYPEYEACAQQCRFQPCLHDREPGCAVRAKVASGELSATRHERYRTLLEEVKATWRGRYD